MALSSIPGKIGVGQVIEDDLFTQTIDIPFPLGKPSLDCIAMLQQLVGEAVESVVGEMLEVGSQKLLKGAYRSSSKGGLPFTCRVDQPADNQQRRPVDLLLVESKIGKDFREAETFKGVPGY